MLFVRVDIKCEFGVDKSGSLVGGSHVVPCRKDRPSCNNFMPMIEKGYEVAQQSRRVSEHTNCLQS